MYYDENSFPVAGDTVLCGCAECAAARQPVLWPFQNDRAAAMAAAEEETLP